MKNEKKDGLRVDLRMSSTDDINAIKELENSLQMRRTDLIKMLISIGLKSYHNNSSFHVSNHNETKENESLTRIEKSLERLNEVVALQGKLIVSLLEALKNE